MYDKSFRLWCGVAFVVGVSEKEPRMKGVTFLILLLLLPVFSYCRAISQHRRGIELLNSDLCQGKNWKIVAAGWGAKLDVREKAVQQFLKHSKGFPEEELPAEKGSGVHHNGKCSIITQCGRATKDIHTPWILWIGPQWFTIIGLQLCHIMCALCFRFCRIWWQWAWRFQRGGRKWTGINTPSSKENIRYIRVY